jgi:hypothetical protein
MRLGLIVSVARDPDAAIRRVHDLGLPTCQVGVGATDAAAANKVRAALDRYGIEATSAVSTGPGPEIYDFMQGPATIGLVPRQYRAARIARMKSVSDFAKLAGIPAVQGHCGFIPENHSFRKIPAIRSTPKPSPPFAKWLLTAASTVRSFVAKPARRLPSLCCEPFAMWVSTT